MMLRALLSATRATHSAARQGKYLVASASLARPLCLDMRKKKPYSVSAYPCNHIGGECVGQGRSRHEVVVVAALGVAIAIM